MLFPTLFALTTALPFTYGQQSSDETILGAYIFHRHGDRTPKILPPTNLTDLGYAQTYQSGQYYRSRYIASDSQSRIAGINIDEVLQSQIQVLAPDDDVLQQSAVAFLQALYPPVGAGGEGASETLANGSTVEAPLNGYQIIPVGESETGAGSEDASWLQSTSNCGKAVVSSNQYYVSREFQEKMKSTREFYQNLAPIIDGVFAEEDMNFDNAYTIWDYINVATIHNATIPSPSLLTDSVLLQLHTLANNHEWNLAYNSSAPIRAISGSQLAAEITQFLDTIISDAGSHTGSKVGIQFGAYATFMSFFGLAGLADANGGDFRGVTDYASSMVFELFTNSSSSGSSSVGSPGAYPSEDEIFVRFLYHNGTASDASEPEAYPLFGSGQQALSWNDFLTGMNDFSIGDTESWCTSCGNTTGTCAAYAPPQSAAGNGESDGEVGQSCSNGVSPAVNGVIGAMVTLAVVLGIEGLIMLLGGFRVVSKKTLAAAGAASVAGGDVEGKA